MGLCERMRSWIVLRARVGVLLLGLSLAQSASPQAVCPAGGDLQNLTQPHYQDTAEVEEGVGFMSSLVQSFLSTVQPNPFPKDLIIKFIKDYKELRDNPDVIKQFLRYEVGFLVCAAIGILYIILMPLVGFFLACCRCCGNCGGRMYQEQTSRIHCYRRTFYWTVFITTLIILAGNICMFKSNEAVKVNVDQSLVELNNTFDNLNTFLTAVPQQVDRVVKESYKTVNEVTKNLNDIGPQLGAEIQDRFRGTLEPVLLSIRLMDQETISINDQLNELNASLARLQTSMNLIQKNITTVKDQINQTISSSPCKTCENLKPELQKLTLDTSIAIPALSDFQSAVDDVVKADLKAKIREVEDYFNNIPQTVTNDTKQAVQNAKQQLDDIKHQISQLSRDVPLSALTNVSDALSKLRREISTVTPQVERGEHIRWGVCVAVSCGVLLVVVCNIMGLILGPLGLRPKADPTARSCTADCGGTFLMMGVGFSFIFSWLFMLLVLLLFLLCGNVYTLLCQPWDDGQLLKLIDTPGLIPDFEVGAVLRLETNITYSDIYSGCEKNESLWSTLRLYEVVDLGDLLNVSKYTEEVQQYFEGVDISLSSLTVLSPEVEKQLSSISAEAKDFDFALITQQINNVSSTNLNSMADKLNEITNIEADLGVQTELRNEASDLRQIQTSIETNIFPQLEELNRTAENLRSFAEKLSGVVGEVLSKVGAAQDFLNANTTQIIRTESREFLDCQMSYFTAFADWANLTVTQQVGRCGPVAGAVDSVNIIVCSNIVESLNAFWFSLGWCMIFFIFSIIFSVKLAKYYRRMKYTDVFDNHIIMNHIPRAK